MKRLLSLFLTVAMVVLSVGACDAGKKGSAVEGKVVDGKGQPIKGLKLIAKQVQLIKGYEHFETTSGADGSFKFKGVFPSSEYIIEPWSASWESVAHVKVQSGPEGETSMLGEPFTIRFTKSKAGVVTDSKTRLQWAPSNGQTMNHFQAEGYAQSLNLDGGGWRLPTIEEIRQIHPGHPLLNVSSDNYVWSGELCSSGARYFTFYGGNAYCGNRVSNNNYRVLGVRSPK